MREESYLASCRCDLHVMLSLMILRVSLLVIIVTELTSANDGSRARRELSAALTLVVHPEGEHLVIAGQHHDVSLPRAHLGHHLTREVSHLQQNQFIHCSRVLCARGHPPVPC